MKFKSSGNKLYKCLFSALIICSFSLVMINILVLILPVVKTNQLSYEEVAIQNIISILAMAVSVWIGLGIVERMDRSSVIELREKSAELEEQLEVNARLSLQFLIDDLKADQRNGITQWIFQRIKGIESNTFFGGIWISLREAEHVYQQLHRCKSQEEANGIFEHYKICVNRIRKELENQECSKEVRTHICDVLDFREVEALFQMGFNSDKETANAHFIRVVEFCRKNEKRFGFGMIEVPNDTFLQRENIESEVNMCIKKQEDKGFSYSYIFNFIGEAYSEIVQYNNKLIDKRAVPRKLSYEQCKYLAYNYCLLAVVTAEKENCETETYYRNYGCAIERVHGNNLTDDVLCSAIEQYKKALKIDSNNQYIYHCLNSAYNKRFEIITGMRASSSRETTKFKISGIIKNSIEKLLEEHSGFQMMYLECFPYKVDSQIMSILYYRNHYLIYHDNDSAKEVQKRLFVIEQIDRNNEYREKYQVLLATLKK